MSSVSETVVPVSTFRWQTGLRPAAGPRHLATTECDLADRRWRASKADESVDPEFLEWKRQREEAAKRPTIPANAPRPQDHKPKASEEPEDDYPAAVVDEATGILMVTIHHDGLDLSIPADPEDWPIMATRAFEQGKIITAIENLLSTREFAKLAAKNYRNKEFGKLYERLAKAGGFDNSGN